METSKKTRPGVLIWTPAPVLNSPTSSPTEDSWKEEDDFFSQMDENGIIGLEEVELEEMCKNKYKPLEPAAPDESEPSQFVKETKPEELSSSLRRLWDQTSSERDQQALLTRWFEASMDNETLRQKNNKQTTRNCPEEEKDGEEDEMESDRRKKHELISASAGPGAAAGLTCSVNLLDVGLADNSGYPCPGSQPASPIKASFLPHLFHFTAEGLAAAPGIEFETFPDFLESLSESICSSTSIRSSPCCPELNFRASPQSAASFSEQFISNHCNLLSPDPTEASEKPHPSPIKTKKLSPESSRTRPLSRVETNPLESKQQQRSHNRNSKIPKRVRDGAAAVDEFRSLSHQTPDFSKVEPRVNFPKSGYTPPRSKQSPTGTSLSHGPPIVFKSAAEIVEDVLFNNSDGYSTSTDSNRTPTSAAKFIVPLEFRSRQQATNLYQQLEEEYSKLLIKYAEAENTIDRLRLEAKVNLNSDPPKAGLSVHSGLNHNASQFLKLEFSQAQRAAISSAPLYSGTHSTLRENSDSHPSNPQSGQRPTNFLFSQTEKFHQQLHDSEDLLKSENLTAFQKMEVLSGFSEELDSLERSYLLAQDEHKLLQQRGVETCCFDPERELEGLIFQCGLHIEELKDEQEKICVPSSSLPHSSSEEEQTLIQSQSPPEPSLVSDAAEVETSSASKRSDEEEEEETLKALYQRPQISKQTGVQPQSTKTVNHTQILKEHPKLPKCPPTPDLNTSVVSGSEEEEQNGQRTGNGEVLKISPQRNVESDQDSPVRTRRQRCSRASLPLCAQSSVTSVPPARSRRRLAMRRTPSSSQSSLPDTTSQRRGSKAQTGSKRVLSQNGIISPETDSGFVGSESSHLTPAADPCLLQQRARESVSVPQDVKSRNSPPSSPSLSHTAQESTVSSQLDPNQPRRTRLGQRRPMFSCSTQRCDSQRQHNRAVSRTSEVWIETPSGSEVELSDQYSRSVDSPLISHSDSPPAACCLHGDSQRALSSRQGGNHNEAVVPLQAEVARLKEKLENCLRNLTPLSSVAASPSAQRSCIHHNNSTPFVSFRSEGVWSEESLGRRETQEGDEADQASALSQMARTRSAAQTPKPQQDFLSRSDLEPSTFQVSRCTQTSAAPPRGSLVRSRKTQTWQQSVSDTEEKPDSRDQGRLCPQCLINVRDHGPLGGDRSPSSLSHCSRCGGLKPHKYTKTDHLKQNPSTHQSFQPAESPSRDAIRRYAASPPVLQFVPVCPPPLLLCSATLHTSPDKTTAAPLGTRRPEERKRGRTRRSLSVDRSLDSSLDRAISAARHMKHTSRHMAQSLTSGLQHHELHLLSEGVRTVT